MSARLLCLIVLRLFALALCFLRFPAALSQGYFVLPLSADGVADYLLFLLLSLAPLAAGILLWMLAPRLAVWINPGNDVIEAGTLTETGLARLALQLFGVYLVVRNIGLTASTLLTDGMLQSNTTTALSGDWAVQWYVRCTVEIAVALALIFYAGRIAAWLARRGDA